MKTRKELEADFEDLIGKNKEDFDMYDSLGMRYYILGYLECSEDVTQQLKDIM